MKYIIQYLSIFMLEISILSLRGVITFLAVVSRSIDSRHIVYWPPFENEHELTDFFYRGAFYHSPLPSEYRKIILPLTNGSLAPLDIPKYMDGTAIETSAMELCSNKSRYEKYLGNCRAVLIWKQTKIQLPHQCSAPQVRVMLDNPDAKEWGANCTLSWRLLRPIEKRAILLREKLKFRRIVSSLKPKKKSALIGNAPSRVEALQHEFQDTHVIICNSAISNTSFNSHTNPMFVTAGDAVSHWGIANYASHFRKELIEFLHNTPAILFSSAPLAFRFLKQNPHLDRKIILCAQSEQHPNLNLLDNWRLPELDSTFNIHMIPLAATLSDHIELYGFDGKNPNGEENEDFWPHDANSHYHNLVDTGHQAHPAFDAAREKHTYDRYKNSVDASMSALQSAKISITLKTKSYIEALEQFYRKPS